MANNASQVTRRRFAAGLALGSVALALPFPAFALTLDQAKALIEKPCCSLWAAAWWAT